MRATRRRSGWVSSHSAEDICGIGATRTALDRHRRDNMELAPPLPRGGRKQSQQRTALRTMAEPEFPVQSTWRS